MLRTFSLVASVLLSFADLDASLLPSEGRKGETIFTFEPADFTLGSGELKSNGALILDQPDDGENFNARHWGVWHHLVDRDCPQNSLRGYGCPSFPPEAPQLVFSGPFVDFRGVGTLQVFADLEVSPVYSAEGLIGAYSHDYVTRNGRALNLRKSLITFELTGIHLYDKSVSFGYDDFSCRRGEERRKGSPVCSVRASMNDRGSFLRSTGFDPTKVELRVTASRDLVNLIVRKVEFVWSAGLDEL